VRRPLGALVVGRLPGPRRLSPHGTGSAPAGDSRSRVVIRRLKRATRRRVRPNDPSAASPAGSPPRRRGTPDNELRWNARRRSIVSSTGRPRAARGGVSGSRVSAGRVAASDAVHRTSRYETGHRRLAPGGIRDECGAAVRDGTRRTNTYTFRRRVQPVTSGPPSDDRPVHNRLDERLVERCEELPDSPAPGDYVVVDTSTSRTPSSNCWRTAPCASASPTSTATSSPAGRRIPAHDRRRQHRPLRAGRG
jgi:hypothetical protein